VPELADDATHAVSPAILPALAQILEPLALEDAVPVSPVEALPVASEEGSLEAHDQLHATSAVAPTTMLVTARLRP